jgi:hypothetical protein
MSDTYVPDNVAGVASTDDSRRRAGFSSNMKPMFGQRVKDEARAFRGAVNNLEQAAKYRHLNVNANNVVQGSAGTRHWAWRGFSIQLPDAFSLTAQTLSDVTATLIGFLETIKTVLEAASLLTSSADDLLGLVIDELLAEIIDLIASLAEGTGIYMLPILPVTKSTNHEEVEVDLNLVRTTIGKLAIPGSKYTLAEDLLDQIPQPVTRGGNQGYLQTVVNSLSDAQDDNRPQFGDQDYIAGIAVIGGGPSISDAYNLYLKFRKLFGPLMDGEVSGLPPRPSGLVASYRGEGLSGPVVLLDWDRPVVKAPITARRTYPYWELVSETLYRAPDLASIAVADRTDETISQRPLKEGVYSEVPAKYAVAVRVTTASSSVASIPGFGPILDAALTQNTTTYSDGTSVSSAQGWVANTSPVAIDAGTRYSYYIARGYLQVSGETNGVKSYASETVLYRFSGAAGVSIPAEGQTTSGLGIPPNWYSATLADLFPSLAQLSTELLTLLDQLSALKSDNASYLRDQIAALTAEINRWQRVAASVQSLLNDLIALFSQDFGAFALSFFGKGGNAFLTDLLTQALTTTNTDALDDIASDLEQAQALAEKDILSVSRLKALGNGVLDANLTTGSPNFSNDEVTTGFVLLAGDATLSKVNKVYKLIETFFGSSDGSSDPVGTKVSTAIGPGLAPASTGITFNDDFSGSAGVSASTEVFAGFDPSMSPSNTPADC